MKARQEFEFLTPAEVAAKLRVTTQTVRNLCEGGELADVIRVGRVIRIPRSSFEAFFRSGGTRRRRP